MKASIPGEARAPALAAAVGRARRVGFTLVELLIVVAILGILLALLSGGILRSLENAKKQRRATEIRTLAAAISNYWHDYNRWPHKEGEEQVKGDQTRDSTRHLRIYTTANWKVFNRLSARNTKDNPLQKPYIDEASLSTTTGDNGTGTRVSLLKKRGNTASANDQSTIVDYEGKAYEVTFDLELNTVTVQ